MTSQKLGDNKIDWGCQTDIRDDECGKPKVEHRPMTSEVPEIRAKAGASTTNLMDAMILHGVLKLNQ